jgi:four helix bundle protein
MVKREQKRREWMKYAYEDLEVWKNGMDLVEKVYKLTKDFPTSEKFGIISQLQRASVSIVLNIAEGKGRYHRKEYKQFLYNARGSLYEVNTLLLLSQRLRYLEDKDYQTLTEQTQLIMGQLSGLINYLKEE